MAIYSFNRRQVIVGFFLFSLSFLPLSITAQVTRGQLLRMFYTASTYHNNGNDEKAVETYREIATLAPQYPDTYLRMAELYDEADNVESAIVMYRKYINIEMDDEKVKEPRKRLRELEKRLGMEHYEDTELKQVQQLFAKYNVVQQTSSSKQIQQKSSVSSASTSSGGLQLFSEVDKEISIQQSTEGQLEDGEDNEHASEIKEYARPIQQIDDVNQGLSLFSLSALVETRNESLGNVEEDGVLEEERVELIKEAPLDVDADMATIDGEFARSGGLVEDEDVVIDDAFLAKVRMQPFTSTDVELTVSNLSVDECSAPLLTYAKRNRLIQYNIDPSKATGEIAQPANVEKFADMIAGKWVSSDCNSAGLETWIFDISQTGNVWYVTLDDQSGVYLEVDENFVHESWNAIKGIWAYDHSMSNMIKELKAKTVNAQIQNETLLFSFVTEHQYKPNKTVYTWSRNILDGVTGFIPFGGVVSQVGNTLINYISEKDQQKTYTTTIQFYLKVVTSNALHCEYVMSEKERSSDGEREIHKARKSCYLYKAVGQYTGFDFEMDIENDLLNKKLYSVLKTDAATDISKLYPLAQMTYYGAGTKKSISKAVGMMQKLAEQDNCQRAKAWLVPVCYNLSMDEEAYPLRVVRKQFRKYADETLGELLLENYPYAYSLQADMLVSGGVNTNQIVALYEKAASLGDVYAMYKLGMVYAEGQMADKDAAKAVSYLSKAAEGGYADAYLQLALLYRYGKLVEKDYRLYTKYLFSAINDGSVTALKELSNAHCLGLGVEQNFDMANQIKERYMRAVCDEWKEVLNMYGYNAIM